MARAKENKETIQSMRGINEKVDEVPLCVNMSETPAHRGNSGGRVLGNSGGRVLRSNTKI